MKRIDLIELCKEHAMDNYENGCDRFVECFGDTEWDDFLNGIIGWGRAKAKMDKEAERYRDQDAEAARYADPITREDY